MQTGLLMNGTRPVPIALRTFRDYGPDFGSFAHCQACVRSRRFSDEDIARLFGLDADVHRGAKRLRRTGCGQQKALLYRYYRVSMHSFGTHGYRQSAHPQAGLKNTREAP